VKRRDASRIATGGEITFGELRRMIAAMRPKAAGRMSRVNKVFPLGAALDIYERGIANRKDDEVVAGWRDYCIGKPKRTGDSLIAQNILRDCAAAVPPEPGR
jgi:hypothetical protein